MMAAALAAWCLLIGMLQAVCSQNGTDTADFYSRNITSYFSDFQNLSLLQIRSRFPCDIELRPSPRYGIIVHLEVNASDKDSISQVGAAIGIPQRGEYNSLILQIDMFVEENHTFIILTPVLLFSICISVCSVCLYRYKKHLRASRKLLMTSQAKNIGYGSGQSVDKLSNITKDTSLRELDDVSARELSSGSLAGTVKTRARLFEQGLVENTSPTDKQQTETDRDLEMNAPSSPRTNIKYLIAKFQENEDEVQDFTPKQHIVGIRYSTTPSETPGGKSKIRKKFFMTSAARRRFVSSPLKRLNQHVQAKIRDKVHGSTQKLKVDKPEPSTKFKAGRNMRIYQTTDMAKHANRLISQPVGNAPNDPNQNSDNLTGAEKTQNQGEDGRTGTMDSKSMKDGGVSYPNEVQVSVVYLRSKILRLLAGHSTDTEGDSKDKKMSKKDDTSPVSQGCRSQENEEFKELYELVSALVEPSSGETDTVVAADDDGAYGDVKIYDVRNGTANDIRVSYLSALNEEEDENGEEPIYSEHNFMTVVDLNTPDVSDTEHPDEEDYYEPVGSCRMSDNGVEMRRKTRRMSSRSTQSIRPHQEFMELYDLVTTLMKSSPPPDNGESPADDDVDDVADEGNPRQESTESRDSIYAAHRPNVKYLISTFQANTDQVKDFVPRTGHHKDQCVSSTPPPVYQPDENTGGGRKKRKNLLLSLFGVLSLLTVVHAVTVRLPDVQRLVVYVHADIFKQQAGRIEVFVPQSHHVVVDTDQWNPWQRIPVQVYDVDELPNAEEFCLRSDTCPHVTGYTASRIACHPNPDTCICPRGYVLANDTCIDLDECLTGRHNCHAYAYCENTIGSYICTCNQTLGVWGDGKTCQACSVDCPYEHYISKECTAYQDRECSPCKQCDEDEYEFYGCGIRVNRHCLHPAGSPAVLRDDIDDVTYKPVANKTGYVIHHDDETMIGENLHNTSDLSWIYHVSKPSLDFEERIKLVRESGIELHLTLHEVSLLPRYDESSNEYRHSAYKISGLKHGERDLVERFTQKYCRKLVPDYYTLRLKLYRDRLTSVVTIPCSAEDNDCPDEYKGRGNYTFRSLNDKCPYSDSLPGLAIPDQGTVCLNNIPLLTEIFGQRLEQTPVKRFPSESCHETSSRCEKCLQQNAEADCPVIYRDIRNTTDRDRCCKISCYNTRDCRYALSESCRKVPGDCSQGDVARFVLSAHLDDVHSLSCHLHYARPKQLYSYSYKISYPQLGLESEPQLVSARPPDGEGSPTSRETAEDSCLSVRHDSVLPSGVEDVILRARQVNENWRHARYAFSVHRLKSAAEFRGRPPSNSVVHDGTSDEYRMVFQNGAPFAINKLIYSPTRADHHCPEDVGDFYTKQRIYNPDGIPVTVQAHKDADSRWFDVSPLDKPVITFNLNGNQSLIRQFFRHDGAHLINDDSLEAELDRKRDRGIWLIKVKGYLSHCPGYIGFIVRDAHALLELIRYDALVHCKHPPCDPDDPCKFKARFEIPMSELGDERFFTLKLLDFNNTYEILLASVNRTEFPSLPSFEIPDYLFSLPDFPWTLFGGIIALGVSATVSLVAILIYAEKKNPHRRAKKFRKAIGGKSGWVTGKNAELARRVYVHSNKLQARHCVFIAWTLVFKIAYACVFSFTAFYFLLLVVHHDDLETIRTLPSFVRALNERNENISRAIDHHREQEIVRQQNHTGHMQQSCDVYLQRLFRRIRRQMAEITLFHRLQMFDIRATVSFNVGQLAAKEMREFAWRVGNYTRLYKRKISSELRAVYEPFAEWLHRVMYNGWFQIGVGLYQVRKHFIEPIFDAICLPLPAVSLLDFLGIDAALNINFLPRDLLLKIKHGLPALPTFDIPDLSDMFLNYSLPGFLPDELLHIYIPDIVLPGLDIGICPQWEDQQRGGSGDGDEQSPGSVGGIDSQRSFVTPFDPAARAESDSALEDYLREMAPPIVEANVSGDGRGTIRSQHDGASFHIDAADSEQEFRDRQRDLAAETEVVYTSRVWEYTRLTLFKMFGVLDVVLLLYRLSKIYVVVVQLTRGFTEVIPQTETERRLRENRKAAREFDERRKKPGAGSADAGKKRISQQDVRIYVETAPNKPNIFDRHRLDGESETTTKDRVLCVTLFCFDALTTVYLAFVNGAKALVDKAVHTSLVPKLILVGCACVLTYVVVVVGFLYLTVRSLDELGVYDMLAAPLDVNLEYSNLKVWENAAFLENVTMKAYYEQMQQQLSAMADVINAFNIEQAGIISMYENEICSYRREITGKRDCDFKILFRKLEMELLPCQLISTQPIVYEGYEREAFINETKFESEPYVKAIRNVIIHTFYAVLVVLGLVALITALGYALFEYLKSRNMIRVIKVYQMDREEQTYGAIYRSVKRRQTVRRRERRLKKEEALRLRGKQNERNANADNGNEGCGNAVTRGGSAMRKRSESSPDLDPAAVVVKDGIYSGEDEKDSGKFHDDTTL